MKDLLLARRVVLYVTIVLVFSWVPVGLASPQDGEIADVARAAIARSLPAIRQGGQSWISENDCLSCHRVSFQVWALNRAAEQGFETEDSQLNEWNDWATSWKNIVKPELRDEMTMEKALTRESDTVSQLLLGRSRSNSSDLANHSVTQVSLETEPDWVVTYRNHLANAQREDGSWEPVGQLPQQKRPLRETTEVTTMWVALALRDSGLEQARLNKAISRARDFLDSSVVAQSTEWWAAKLMVERQFGNASKADEIRGKLVEQQRSDGGWGWLTEDESDALGTGIALYALARDGLTFSDRRIQRSIRFLSSTQQSDGTWAVKGTKVIDRDEIAETASYWGTAWATIGMLETAKVSRLPQQIISKSDRETSSGRRTFEFTSAKDKGYEQEIRPLLVKYCSDCHAGGSKWVPNFMDLQRAHDFAKYKHRFVNVVRELERGAMPPRGAEQPTKNEKQAILAWSRSQLGRLTPSGEPVIPDVSRQVAQYVVQIYEDRKGHLWFGTMSRGAARFDGQSLSYLTASDGLPGGGVTSFAEDSQGKLWIGTQEGICCYDGKSVQRFDEQDGLARLKESQTPFPPGGGNVFTDNDQNIWANMYSGVFRWEDGRFVRFELPFERSEIDSHGLIPGNAALTLEDSQGHKWFTVDGYGVFRFDGKRFTSFTKKDGLCSNNVNDILEDSKGNLWFICMQSHQPHQTGDGGVCRFDGKTFESFPDVKGLHQNDIYTIGMDFKGNIWIGATGVGVYRYDGDEFELVDKTDRMDLSWSLGLQAFHQSRSGTVWLGFSGGLFRIHGNSIINVDRDGPWDSVGVSMANHVLGEHKASNWLRDKTLNALVALEKGDAMQATSLLQAYKREEPHAAAVQQNTLNTMGYELLTHGLTKTATDVLRINTKLYPNEFNTFDSLAYAYLRQGNEELAVTNYERSLELNPNNRSAARSLREIGAGRRFRGRLIAPDDWMEEVLTVPPAFATDMTWDGMEHLRLPPDFREQGADRFLSYLFVVELTKSTKLNQKLIGQQLLTYFRGLASGGRDKEGKPIDVSSFKMEAIKEAFDSGDEFAYVLDWQEPFTGGTALKQNIRVKVVDDSEAKGVVFVCTSPQPYTSNVWAELLRIRKDFEAR